MQFINTILLAATALASMAYAQNTVQFVNQESVDKTIKFTASAGLAAISELSLPASSTATQEFPSGWIGNFYSINVGAADVPGMLGEVTFQGWNGLNYFDVSSIVNTADVDGIKQMYPVGENLKSATALVSGCNENLSTSTTNTVCTSQYNQSDDIATVSTTLTSFMCMVGNPTTTVRRRKIQLFSRDYVTGAISQ